LPSDIIEFECPRCLQNIRVGKEQSGTRVDCPGCSGSLLVPTQSTGQDLFDDIFDSPKPKTKQPAEPVGDPLKKPVAPAGDLADPISDLADLASDSSADPIAALHAEATKKAVESYEVPELETIDEDQDLLAGLAIPSSKDDAPIPLEGDDPFKVDPDAPIKIDGIGDVFSHDDVFGIKCHICDTRIHVRPEQIGNKVECPECYSKIEVTSPRAKSSMRWEKEGRGQYQKRKQEEEELKLSAPIERPKVEIDESFGLAPVEEDLLAPKTPVPEPDLESADHEDIPALELIEDEDVPALEMIEADVPALEVIDDDDPFAALGSTPVVAPVPGRGKPAESKRREKRKKPLADEKTADENTAVEKSAPAPGKRKSRKTRRELYEDSQRLQAEQDQGSVRTRVTKKGVKTEYPDFQIDELVSSSIEMIKSPGVRLRAAIAFGLMCFGALTMELCFPFSFGSESVTAELSLAERLFAWAKWSVFGGLPYMLGLGLLWWIGSHIFRDAALGHRKVATWKKRGKTEWLSTFLIFAFGFFMGGLPSFFFSPMIMPLRVLLGPLFLVAAWYNESPFQIVSVDAFASAKNHVKHWIQFYKFMAVLALLGVVNGFFFWFRAAMPYFVLDAIILILGIAINVAITLVFAAVCGWHCGTVMEHLKDE